MVLIVTNMESLSNEKDVIKGISNSLVVSAIECAVLHSKMAHAPYSNFHVGSSILLSNGELFGGFNIENIAFGNTICAERNAIANALINTKTPCEMNGTRKLDASLVVVYNKNEFTIAPCGNCRQSLSEMIDLKTRVLLMDGKNEIHIGNLEEFLPYTYFEGITSNNQEK